MKREPVFIVDTREQRPFLFKSQRTQRAKLDAGDYSIKGLTKVIAVERKAFGDVFTTLSKKQIPRFERELERLQKFKYKAIAVEASPLGIRAGSTHSYASGLQALRDLTDICNWYGVQLLFGCGRAGAEELTKIFLLSAARCCQARGPQDLWRQT